jgi:hypothetical protein
MAKAKKEPNLCYRLNGIVGVHPLACPSLWTIGNNLFKPRYEPKFPVMNFFNDKR